MSKQQVAPVDVPEHIAALRRDGEALAAAAALAGPDAPVPTCPDWCVRDLVRHLGGIHRWATAIVSERRSERWDVDLEEVVGTWPDDGDLIAWFRDGHRALAAALEEADPALHCWTFLPAPSPLAMWARRQAHETAMHRVDAERALGVPSSFAPAFAADGIDELLSCFVPRPRVALRADPPRSLRIRTVDAQGDWLVRIQPDRVETSAGAAGADCDVRGSASDLYLTLWNRQAPADLAVDGDADVLTLFLDNAHLRRP